MTPDPDETQSNSSPPPHQNRPWVAPREWPCHFSTPSTSRVLWYGKSVTVIKVTVSLDPAVADRAKQDVTAGRAKSLSSWLNEAARAHVERQDLAAVLSELLDETGGPPSDIDLAEAETRLTVADRR